MNIQEEDLKRITSLANILDAPDSEVVHMAVSLLLLKVNLPLNNKELVILDNNSGTISGIKYGYNSK